VEKYGTARQPADDYLIWRMRVACWVNEATDTHTLRICNISCFSTTTTVSRSCLNITFICTLSVSLMYYIDIWLHVTATSGHPQAVKTEITIIAQIVGCSMVGATYVYVPSVSFVLTA
jgi:hypothetical protein